MGINSITSGDSAIGLVGLIALVFTVIGNAVIWVKGVDDTSGLAAIFMIVIAGLNLGCLLQSRPSLGVVAIAFMFGTIDINTCSAHTAHQDEKGAVLAGYVIAIIGCFLSFVSIPVEWRTPQWRKSHLVTLLVTILLGIALIIYWSDRKTPCGTFSALFLMFIYFISSVLEFVPGYQLSLIVACQLLVNYQPFGPPCKDACEAAYILLFISMIILILYYCYQQSTGCALDTGKASTPIGIAAIILFIITLVGSIVVWAKYKSSMGCFVAAILLVISLLNLFGHLTGSQFLSVASFCLAAAVIQAGVDDIYGSLGDEGIRSGFILAMSGAFLSFITLPVESLDLPTVNDENRLPAIAGLLLLSSTIIGWHGLIIYGWIGLSFLISTFLRFQLGVTYSYLLSLIVFHATVPLGKWSPIIISFIGLVVLLIYQYPLEATNRQQMEEIV